MIDPSRHSIERGDVVLCNLPPYSTQPWLSMGVVLHHAYLAEAGIRSRVVRPIDPPFAVPQAVLDASLSTLCFDPSLAERRAAMDRAYDAAPGFFEGLADELLVGGEAVVGLSVFRNNVDVTLRVAQILKERRPDLTIVIGGPEAIEDPAELLVPFVDAVVGVEAECVIVPLMRALLDGRFEAAAELRNVWTRAPGATPPARRERRPVPPLPVIDYAPLMRLFVGVPEPTVPLLMNWGCPYHCAYCSNRTTYARFTEGPIDRVLTEMDRAVTAWRTFHDGAAPPLGIQLSDATTNALPRQLDALLDAVVERIPSWGMRPSLRGQTLFDARVTPERVRLWAEAGFHSTFFGLDVVDDARRRDLKRPGKLAQVRDAVCAFVDAGLGQGLGIGIPIGIPGETEAHFERAAEFTEWALSLRAELQSFTVLPYVFFQSAQDPSFVRLNRGPPRGVLWRGDGPSGDPAVRARRFMTLYDRIDGRAPTMSPIPPYLMLPAMLPSEDPAKLEAWMQRHGRVFDQIEPGDAPKPSVPIAPDGPWARALRVLERGAAPWGFEAFEHDAGQLTVVYRHEDGEARLAVLLEPRSPARRSFAHTQDFNVSYLNSWRGMACVSDPDWLRRRVKALSNSESG